MNYTFRVQTEDEIQNYRGGSKICDIYDFFQYARELQSKIPLALGQLKTRFGEPSFISKNYEEMYEYNLCAESETGEITYLCAYCGPTGPAIGGSPSDPNSQKAAQALVNYIIEAAPIDYEMEAYYLDVPSKLTLGVKNGQPHYSEEEIDFDDPELKKLFNF